MTYADMLPRRGRGFIPPEGGLYSGSLSDAADGPRGEIQRNKREDGERLDIDERQVENGDPQAIILDGGRAEEERARYREKRVHPVDPELGGVRDARRNDERHG